MEYITVQDAAENWGISQRIVQKYCACGRIDGADKVSGVWRIPAGARRPQDRRTTKEADSGENCCYSEIMPLMNSSFPPGKCLEYIENMDSCLQKEIAFAEYFYFTGRPELAAEKAELYLTNHNRDIRLSACLIYAYANLSIGKMQNAKYALGEIKAMAEHCQWENSAKAKAAESFMAFSAAVLLHLPLPKVIPSVDEYIYLLPAGLKAFALYVTAHYLYLQGDYSRSLGIVEGALAMDGSSYPIPSIYLHLVAVMDLMSLKKRDEARAHLLSAWKTAKPDDLIEGFGEHHGLLGGMLEAVIKKDWPEDFKRIIAITYRFSEGWRKVHNPYTGHDVADNLTTTEFTVAMLAARGWKNMEIGDLMNISPNTVKKYISTILQKLHINSRKDLKKYMLL